MLRGFLPLALPLASAHAAVAQNAIVDENQLAGNPASEWDVSGAGDTGIQGFATDISVDQGGTVEFKIDTDATDYRLDVYRLGFYGGLGARKVATVQPSAALPQSQPACLTEPASGLIDCGNWSVSASWAVPANATSGIYVAKLVREDAQSGASHVVFVVRDDDGASDVLVQTSDTTWQAYNSYGGNSLYTGSPAGRAYKVSYNRPFTTRCCAFPAGSIRSWLFDAEYPLLRWLEKNGYDVSYTTGVDTDRRGAELLGHEVFVSVGHDEYWSAAQRANVEAARAAGVHLAFLSGNEVFWKTRWEPSLDASATSHRTLVSYKETHADAKIDPDPAWTGTWRDPRFSPPADGGQPENALTGTIFTVNGIRNDALEVPEADGKMRFWRNTSVASLAPGQVAVLPTGTLGFEWDEDLDNGFRPPGLIRLSTATVSGVPLLQDFGSDYASGTATHHLTLYRHASGALVFGAGTVQWSWGLDDQHDLAGTPVDPSMQQATVNLLADMGAQPGTLDPTLVAATVSGDATPPSSSIVSPAPGATLQSPVTVTGTASDLGGGVVGGVEVSYDDGASWHPAEGRESWSYSFTPATFGSLTLRVRAVDDSANLEIAGPGIPLDVEPPACPCTIWADTVVPGNANANDPQPVEIGVRFRASEDGFITGLRFYKGAANNGTHVGHLWSSGGAQLAEATFTGESASGWQQVTLAQPVAVSAGTTYVASYHTSSGNYAFTSGYFATGVDSPPLRALADGEDGPNGVYKYGASGFPTDTFQSSNYWVDVVFSPTPGEFSAWDDTATPTQDAVSDGQPIEVGVKFQALVAGSITGLRFYKGAANTGAHVGHLWTSAGAQLAAAIFTGETASGWQEVAFASPLALVPGATYVASYHSASGFFAFDAGYFANERVAGPLRLLANGADGPNGVFSYGASAFPDQGNGANYWVDVIFTPDAPFDGDPPGILSVTPVSGDTNVTLGANVTARFDEPIDVTTLTAASFELQGGGGAPVAAVLSYASATRIATLDPSADLAASTPYTATVKGGAAGVRDPAGNALAADFVWSFTTQDPPPPPPDEGPGGPILVVASAANPFGRYYAEILRSEGFNAFFVTDVSNLDAALLAAHEVVILAEQTLGAAQAALLTSWVDGGGQLIAMRPGADLLALLGLAGPSGTLADAYLAIDTGAAPGAGLVSDTIQFHGTADRYTLAGASALATLYSGASTATVHPAVTLRSVGSNGGRAAAFSYDLARSVVYTRQGNPAWVGQERDGFAPLRPDDLFFPDWIDLDKVAIPQADEQQRLLANLILLMSEPPLPRFWYFPSGHEAVVVLTGDQHGCCGGTRDRFAANLAQDPPACSVEDWECVRSSSYVYPNGDPENSENVPLLEILNANQGFELGVHVDTGCADWTPASLDAFFTTQLASFAAQFPSLPSMDSHRTHCIAWSDWASAAEVELAHGVRLDTNYYYWPPSWVQDRPGLFTGSGMPMRFAREDGSMIDVYQATTQMTDESGQTYPFTIDTLLDRALGPEGYYGAFTANMHTDGGGGSITGAAAIVGSAQARGVPVVSGRQLLEWLDGRNASTFANLVWSGTELSFTLTQAAGARNLRAMLPLASPAGPLLSLTRGGLPVAFTPQLVKGVQYAVFDAQSGSYLASYAPDGAPPLITAVSASASGDGTASVSWTTSEAATSRVDYGTSPASLTSSASVPGFVSAHSVPLSGLLPGTTYHYRVVSADAFANEATDPAPPAAPGSFVTPSAPCFSDTTLAEFAAGAPNAGVLVAGADGGELILAPLVSSDFDGAALPAGWSATAWEAGGGAGVSGGVLSADGARVGTDASFGPGRSLEFVATFAATPFQHVGFGVSYEAAPWAMFSTGAAGSGLLARSHDGATATDTALGAALVGGAHRFRIDWSASSVNFFVDGALAVSHPVAIAGPLRPLASDLNVGVPLVSLDWLRMTPFASAGSFASRIGDAGVASSWGPISFSRDLPSGTSAALLARSGPTPAPGALWTPWTEVPVSGAAFGQVGRYAQYRVDLATSDPDQTPVLRDVTLACAPAPDADSDGDGLRDADETLTDPLVPDSDGDGFNDGLEVAAGTDPGDAGSFPAPGVVGASLAPGGPRGGTSATRAHAVSADGSALVGLASTPSGDGAFLWSAALGSGALGDLAGGAFASEAFGVSADGAVAVGRGTSASGPEAFRWTSAGGLVGLGDFAGGVFESEARATSADGAVVVGSATGANGREAFRWTSAGGLLGLGDLAGGALESEAFAVSGDGSVVVGRSTSAAGSEGFHWTFAGGMVGLGDLVGGTFSSAALDVSANGAVVVGSGDSDLGPLAFRWTQSGGMLPLGELAGGAFGSEARGVSADGAVVVGTSEGATGPEAFVWTQATGPRRLASVLVDDLGLDLSGWDRLVAAEDVSDGGTLIVGHGLRSGVESAFLAYLAGDCSDGADDDGDTLVDYPADAGCSSPLDRSERPECADGLDNDGDGLTDHPSDPGCAHKQAAAREAPACSNGRDDDLDGNSDRPADIGCASLSSANESPQCQDGLDNDGALGTDFDGGVSVLGLGGGDPNGADPQCSSPTGTSEAAPPPSVGCGIGVELLPALGLLLALRRRRRAS